MMPSYIRVKNKILQNIKGRMLNIAIVYKFEIKTWGVEHFGIMATCKNLFEVANIIIHLNCLQKECKSHFSSQVST